MNISNYMNKKLKIALIILGALGLLALTFYIGYTLGVKSELDLELYIVNKLIKCEELTNAQDILIKLYEQYTGI